ncbi:glycosyltransferase family 2 protein [Epibacterium sp. MM17-32]|uniref:glycosyltransferase family 2 protein n=1 Tax=Epibacterium sp. MM17-32 TaxID=2917734 RepID=UPI0021049639|nr:glycosyltransferase family 2 protein [Epibacterium sp. MM17-32]MCG7630325.1 glycosyltransferase family 2 protein [Epibacterium sp. MM17-32]
MQPERVPTVSVIMPVFNARMTLEQSVASVMAQVFADWELILIDDGSQDGSAELCAQLARTDPRIRLLCQSANSGAAAARNAGLAQAKGQYIAFLDADDLWLEDKLQRQIAFMQETGAVFSYTGFWRQRTGHRHQVRPPSRVTRSQLLYGNVIGCLTVVYDRDYFGTVAFPPLRMRQDFAFWLLLLSRCDAALGLTDPLAVHVVNPMSLTAARGRAMQATWSMYRHHLGLSVGRAGGYMFCHLLRRLLRG